VVNPLGVRLSAPLTHSGFSVRKLEWYDATRHTFASQWVLAGNSIEKLKEILGHYSVIVTERYAHLKPGLFTQKDMAALPIDLRATPTQTVRLHGSDARAL